MLSRVAVRLSDLTERVVPSAFAIALLLTFLTFVVAIGVAGAPLSRVVIEWGNGFWTLVPFAMQMALVVLTGYLVSTAPVVDRLFARVASRTRTPRGAVVRMALVSMGLAWFHWGLSLVGCAMFVRHVVRAEPKVDYRLLVCAAYFGMGATWHAGLSASAPLLVATPGHFLEGTIGLIPVSATIFSPFNLALTALVVTLLATLAWVLHPEPGEARPVDPAGKPEGNYLVAVDTVDAGVGETVLVVSGSSARMAAGMKDCPVDAAVVGIIDHVDLSE